MVCRCYKHDVINIKTLALRVWHCIHLRQQIWLNSVWTHCVLVLSTGSCWKRASTYCKSYMKLILSAGGVTLSSPKNKGSSTKQVLYHNKNSLSHIQYVKLIWGHTINMSFYSSNEIIDEHSHVSRIDFIGHHGGNYEIMSNRRQRKLCE